MTFVEASQTFRDVLAGYRGFWCVAGGWAVDLFLDRQTRDHEDLEIVVLRDDRPELFRHFEARRPQKIWSGEPPRFEPWRGEEIEPAIIQLRLQDVGACEFDLLLTPSEGDQWICRRDESLRRPLAEVAVGSRQGVPILAPEIVLLFKAKYLREKDRKDYENLLPALSPSAKAWLRHSLRRIHPGHPWS